MTMRLSLTVAATTLLLAGLAAPAARAGDDPATELAATEEAFARTMAERDHAAFVSFLAPEAVFFGRRGEIRGREAVATAWKPLFDGPEAPFSWRPESATVLDSGGLGLTSGPVLAPDGRRVGTFNTVWRREADGSWRVVFDRGCPDCECPSAAVPAAGLHGRASAGSSSHRPEPPGGLTRGGLTLGHGEAHEARAR
jgi:ketosteroid isomerase-like protein